MKKESTPERIIRGLIGLFAIYVSFGAIKKSMFFGVALYILGAVWVLIALIGHWPFDRVNDDSD